MHTFRMTAAGALLAGLMACTVPGGANSAQGSEVPIPAGQGLLVLKWKGEARNLLGSSWASSVADAYELILQAAAGTRAVVLDSGSGQAVSVDPGTYRATVLAGVKRSSGSSTAFLVGSATEEAVAVVLGQRTEVNFVMKSIDLGLSAGGPAYWKGSLTVNASGKTRNPRVGMQLAGASTTNRPRFKSVELWNGYHEAASVTGTPDDWTAQVTGTVPSSGTGLTVGLIGAALCVQDLDNQWIPTSGTTGFSWYWTNRADLADAHPLVPFSEVAVACGPPPTGLDVSVGWE